MVRLQKHKRQHGWTCPQPSPSLCRRIVVLERGPFSRLVMMKMKHTHTCHSKARVRADGDERATRMETPLRSSMLSFESCHCHQVFLSSNPQVFALPMERFFTRRAGPRTTALGFNGTTRKKLVRDSAAAQLEMERWPPAMMKRRVEKATMDEQYTQALCNWVATLEAPGGIAAGCLPSLPLDADTATMAGREQEGRPRTARCLRSDHSHSPREVRPCWRDRRPDIRVCDAAHLQQSGRATRHDTQIQHQMDPPFSPHGPQAGGQEGGQASIALNVLRDGVRSAPLLHHQHGRDCSGRDRSKMDGLRFTGAADKRILTIWTVVSTIMAQLIVEGTTERVVQDLPQHEKLPCSFSESHWCTESTCQELIEWLGAWVRKQGFLHWVLLWDCDSVNRKASLME